MLTAAREGAHKEWGRRIRLARKAIGLTQVELAEKTGATQHTISRYESGSHAPSDGAKIRLASVLGRSLDELFSWPENTLQVASIPQRETADS